MSAWVAPDPGERRKNRGWRRDRGRRAEDRGFPDRGLGHFLWLELAKDVPLCDFGVELAEQLRQVVGLVMEHQREDLEARQLVRVLEATGFVDENAQRPFSHVSKKEGDGSPRLLREEISPHPDDPGPARRRTQVSI